MTFFKNRSKKQLPPKKTDITTKSTEFEGENIEVIFYFIQVLAGEDYSEVRPVKGQRATRGRRL